jgi:hypothetical protein
MTKSTRETIPAGAVTAAEQALEAVTQAKLEREAARKRVKQAEVEVSAAYEKVRAAEAQVLEVKYGVPGRVQISERPAVTLAGFEYHIYAELAATVSDGSALYEHEGRPGRKSGWYLRTPEGEVKRHQKGWKESGPLPAPTGRYSWTEEYKRAKERRF